MGHVTILGQNISLIRPCKVVKHTAQGAWKRLGESRKTHKLTFEDKQRIAAFLGYRMTNA